MNRANFSVVTPNFNMGRFLPDTIESVLVNLRPGDEYFVVDGGSTDSSVEILRKYESRLTGWISEKDRGYADALRKGFSRARGDLLCWVNCGDLLLPGALDGAAAALDETKADLVFGDDYYIDEEGGVIQRTFGGARSLRNIMLFGGWTPLQDACYWRRSLYERVGGIDPDLMVAADFDFFLRAAWASRNVYVPRAFSAFRRHLGQKSIANHADYESERRRWRRRMEGKLGVSAVSRLFFETVYWVAVRWRHFVLRRFRDRPTPAGTHIRDLKAD
jgi:glycosyltransferase involved in cell wall biosynthesis